MGGRLTLTYSGTTLDFGIVTSVSPQFSKTCTVVPLVSLRAESTFAVESSSTETYQFGFTYKGSDITSWYNSVTDAVNRWQCRTNGFVLNYIPDADTPYIPAMRNVRGYVKSITRTYSSAGNEIVTGTLTFQVGTMYVTTTNVPSGAQGVPQTEFSMFISDAEGTMYCLLGTNGDQDINCIESYTLTGGLEQPFEYITVRIPKQRLSSVAPALVEEHGIIAGKSKLSLNAIGLSEMTVTKCKLSNNTYTITAYADSERLRGYSLGTIQAGSRTPSNWIRYILTSGDFGVAYVEGTTYLVSYKEDVTELISFEEGTNVWYILQVCAMLLGARIFFADGNAYVVDYRTDNELVNYVQDGIDLYNDPRFENSVVDHVSLGDEGVDTIANKISIKYTSVVNDESGSTTESIKNTWSDEKSIDEFDEREGNTLSIPELTYSETEIPPEEDPETGEIPDGAEPTIEVVDTAEMWAKNFLSYRSEPQQSISFTLKEMTEYDGVPTWRRTFDSCSRTDSITDAVDDVVITNSSDIEDSRTPVLQKLTLSTFERHYPEGTTTYTWGVMANIDLSTSTSQINTSLYNS